MKTKFTFFMGMLLLSTLTLAVLPTTRDEIHWRWSTYKDETSRYESYVKSWPSGRHATEATTLYDERLWRDTQNAGVVLGFERYLQTHPEGNHVTEAHDNIESLHWEHAASGDTITLFQNYVKMYPKGRFLSEARDNIESLHWEQATSDDTFRSFQNYVEMYPKGRFLQEASSKQAQVLVNDTAFLRAQAKGTEKALKDFLDDFPGHRREMDARSILIDMEGRDIVDLIREKKVEVETQGSGIQSVSVRVRRLVPHPITVRIPVGTFFVSRNRSSQNMVTTSREKRTLTDDDWVRLSISAACANRPRGIPGSSDSFAVQRSPHQAELARLISFIDKADVEFAVKQAAVWIVTDNADYSDLGILVNRSAYQMYGGTRVIHENHAARAIKICDEAGINISNKAIWKDRKRIAKALPSGELKRWFSDAAIDSRLSVRAAQKQLADNKAFANFRNDRSSESIRISAEFAEKTGNTVIPIIGTIIVPREKGGPQAYYVMHTKPYIVISDDGGQYPIADEIRNRIDDAFVGRSIAGQGNVLNAGVLVLTSDAMRDNENLESVLIRLIDQIGKDQNIDNTLSLIVFANDKPIAATNGDFIKLFRKVNLSATKD